MAVCRLEQEPSLSELLKPSLWDCTLELDTSNTSYSTRTHVVDCGSVSETAFIFVPFSE